MLETVKLVLEVYRMVYHDGMLKPIIEHEDDPVNGEFYGDCLEYMCTPDITGELYENLLLSGNYQGKELLRDILIAEGLLHIKNGCREPELIDVLASVMGKGWNFKILEMTTEMEEKR